MANEMEQAIQIMSGTPAPTPTPTPEPEKKTEPVAGATAPAVTPETKTTPDPKPAEPSKEAGEFASKFAALNKREKTLQEREAKVKESEKASKEGTASLETLRGKAKANPLDALKELGLTYEQVTQYILDGKMAPPPDEKYLSLEQKIQKMEDDKKADETRAAEAKVAQATAAFKQDIEKFVTSNTEKYGLIGDAKATELVYQVVEQHYAKTKEEGEARILSIEEACELVEKHLETEAEKWMSFPKIKAKLGKTSEKAPATPPSPTMKKEAETSVTLTNGDSSTSQGVKQPAKNRDDEIAEAAKLLRFTKGS